MYKIILYSLLGFLTTVQASEECLVTDAYLDSQQLIHVDTCYLNSPLQLNREGSFATWSGGFGRDYQVQQNYIQVLSNRCTRQVERRTRFSQLANFTKSFLIRNPNRETTSRHTYDLLPMTDEEAQKQMQDLQSTCESFKPEVR